MTTLPERLKDVIAEMRSIAPTCESDWCDQLNDWADRLEAAQSLQAAPEVGEWVLVPRELCAEVEDQLNPVVSHRSPRLRVVRPPDPDLVRHPRDRRLAGLVAAFGPDAS